MIALFASAFTELLRGGATPLAAVASGSITQRATLALIPVTKIVEPVAVPLDSCQVRGSDRFVFQLTGSGASKLRPVSRLAKLTMATAVTWGAGPARAEGSAAGDCLVIESPVSDP